MAYTDVTATTPLKSVTHKGETFIAKRAVKLDPSADVVAVTWTQKRTPGNSLSIRVTVWLVGADGEANRVLDPDGDPIIVDFKQNVVGSLLTQYTAGNLIKRIAGVLIGEPVPAGSPLTYPPDILEELNIRSAISCARAQANDINITL